MYSHTKKVGSTGRYGPRIGTRLRSAIRKIEDEKKVPHKCPECGKERIKKQAVGIWICASCGLEFAGGAYIP